MKKYATKACSENGDDGFSGQHVLRLDGDELREKGPTGTQDIKLSRIPRVDEDSKAVYIYVGPMAAHVIPRARVLEGDLDSFLNELRRGLAHGVGTA